MLHGSLIRDRPTSQTTTPCFYLGSDIRPRRSRQPPRQFPGRHGPIAILRSTPCGPLSINLSWGKGMFLSRGVISTYSHLLLKTSRGIANRWHWFAPWSQHGSLVALIVVTSISTMSRLLRLGLFYLFELSHVDRRGFSIEHRRQDIGPEIEIARWSALRCLARKPIVQRGDSTCRNQT